MVIPISITHPSGAGLAAMQVQELPTAGPFSRLDGKEQREVSECSRRLEEPQSSSVADSARLTGEAVSVKSLSFAYPGLDGRPVDGVAPLLQDVTSSLKAGSRCLLLGANGAGKTTLLKILGGKHMIERDAVRVLGRSPFYDTQLTISGDLSYIGGTWQRDIAFAGYSIPLTGDFPASKMIDAVPDVDPARKQRLLEVLDIDPNWRMHMVSDGQRRRVQICVGLLKPFKVLLLDEITVDLDVLARADLMNFLKDECETRGACILYATHIFDGLESWPTHLAYMVHGRMAMFCQAADVPQLKEGRLLELVLDLLKEQQAAEQRPPVKTEWDPSLEYAVSAHSTVFNNGWIPGTLNSSLYGSSNAVIRT